MKVGDQVKIVHSIDKGDIHGGHVFRGHTGEIVSITLSDDPYNLDVLVRIDADNKCVPFYAEEVEVINV